MKRFYIFLGITSSLTFGFTACVKESRMNIDPDSSVNIIQFSNTTDNTAGASSVYPSFYTDLGTLLTGESAEFNLNVNYAAPDVAPADITVNIEVDTAALNLYNEQNGTEYVVPPTDVFTFPASLTIRKGERTAQGLAKITNTSSFNFSDSYALPLKIASTNEGVISSNFGKAIYAFGVRNAFDGHYSFKGYALRGGDAGLTGNFVRPQGMNLVTQGARVVQFAELQVWGNLSGVGVGNPVLTIKEDNSVTLSSSGNITNAPGYNSRYDPATKTFYISFTWGAGPAARLAVDTLTYTGPR